MTRPNPLPAVDAFVRVARHGSFTRAAAELDVSTSALSQIVRGLEARLGVRLLNRTTRRVGLTEHGERFLQRVAPGLQQIDAAFADLDFLRDRPSGLLRINLAGAAAEQLICPHLPGFLARYPDVAVELYADRTLADIVAGGFDAGIRLGESLARDMVAVPIGPRLRQAIVATPGYFERHGVPAAPAELVGHDCIRWRRSDGRIQPWEFTRDGRDFQVEVEGRLIVNDMAVGMAALRRGVGLGQVFEWEIADEVAAGGLLRVLDDWQAPFAGWHLYYPAREHMAPKLRVFIDYLRRCLGNDRAAYGIDGAGRG
ncbi:MULTISPECIES: LysR family transcriptional regulator [Gammaproteobacteria]|jgi:DNA-binding transcriptional LysR family regulator|uniref:LysR family transcriptional regulator n=1 Tax=Xanthomonas boreopolis TaxID=86183 RepID=A0A919F9K5_9XANT|nr:LysR family transcriptional regulator [Pseudomonas sp. Hp2]GHH57584.1 LysR family transcriptional regulator [[Pseudomonas] boreopolis]